MGVGIFDAPVDLAETADTDGLAHVDVAGNGGGADVEPVDALGRELAGVWAVLGGCLCGGKRTRAATHARS